MKEAKKEERQFHNKGSMEKLEMGIFMEVEKQFGKVACNHL